MNALLEKMVIVFKENESKTKEIKIDTHNIIDNHQMCIEIMEAIQSFKNRKQLRIDSINGFSGTFPELRRKYSNDIDTINMCINRLYLRYENLKNQL